MKTAQGEDRVLEGRRALVIGGSGGIGRALSLELGARGGHTSSSTAAPPARNSTPCWSELSGQGTGAEGFLLDLGDPVRGLDELLESLPSLGVIDILVVAFGPFLRIESRRDERRGLATPSPSSTWPCQEPSAPRSCRRWRRGAGAGSSFSAARAPTASGAYSSNAAYAAAKTGLAVLAKSLAAEGAANGVACVLACPGFVDTEYLEEAERAALRARSPGTRLASPGEIAATTVALISAEPCLASGAILSLDGGLTP